MHSAIALFDDAGTGVLERTWEALGDSFGLTGIRRTPIPHMSWDVFGSVDEGKIGELLRRRAEGTRPFEVHLHGLGIFPGADPVLYLGVTKTGPLLQLHGSMHDELTSCVGSRSPLYSPQYWVPHVTLAHHDGDLEGTVKAVHHLLGTDLPDVLRVTALGWIRQPVGEVGSLAARFELHGG